MNTPIGPRSSETTEKKTEAALAVEGRKRLAKPPAGWNPFFAARFMGVGLSLGGFEYQYGHNNVADHIADLAALSHQRTRNSERGITH